MPRLTARAVAAARCPAGVRDKTFWDDVLLGFGLRVRASGAKTFIVRYEWRGRKKRFTLGTPALLTVEKARDKARKALLDVLDGRDPSQQARDLVDGPTVAMLADRYLAKRKGTKGYKTFKSAIETHIKPLLGNLTVAGVQPADCGWAIQSIAEGPAGDSAEAQLIRRRRLAGGASIARLAHGILVTMFSEAERQPLHWRPRKSNPMEEIDQPKPKGRHYVPTLADYAALGAALRHHAVTRTAPPGALLAFWLYALTGARRNEIRFAPLKACDVARQTIHLVDSKVDERLLIVGAMAARLIAERIEAELAVDGDPGNWLIAPLGRKTKPVHLWQSWVKVRTMAGLPKLRLHDLRHGFTSLGNEIGVPYPIVMALLGHSAGSDKRINGLPGTTAEYLHVGFEAARAGADRIAAAIWNAMNARVEAGGDDSPAAALPMLPPPIPLKVAAGLD